MFARPPGKNRPTSADRAALNGLGAALAGLPAPWTVLASRRASGADGPPWVKYIAFHPRKGIALVDLLSAQPEAAVAPLKEFLARTGFAAFSHGDPPIVALALAEEDFPTLSDSLEDIFAEAPRCRIKSTNWTEAVTELLMRTPELLLTHLESPAGTAAVPRASHPADQARDPPPKRTPPSQPEASSRGMEEFRVEPAPRTTSAGSPASAGRSEPARRSDPVDRPDSKKRREPAFRSEMEYRREPRLSATRTLESSDGPKIFLDDDDRHRTFEGHAVHRRPVASWVIAASLVLIAVSLSGLAAVAIFSSRTPAVSSNTVAPTNSASVANDALPDLAKPPPIETKPVTTKNELAAKNRATETVASKPAALHSNSPVASRKSPPATGVKPAVPLTKAIVAKNPPSLRPTPEETASTPSHGPGALRPLPTKQVAAPPTPHSVVSPAPSPTALAHAKRPIKRENSQGDLSGYSYVNPRNTVTINGTTYVAGREPHNLGTITVPAPQANTDPSLAPAPTQRDPIPLVRTESTHAESQTRTVLCADPLHQDRPGGSDYHGPPVPGCPSVP